MVRVVMFHEGGLFEVRFHEGSPGFQPGSARAGPGWFEVRFHGFHRVPPEFYHVLRGLRAPRGFHQASTRVPPGSATGFFGVV